MISDMPNSKIRPWYRNVSEVFVSDGVLWTWNWSVCKKKKLTNLWCTITFAFSQVASRQKNSANSQNTNLAIILWHCNFTIFHMSWAYFSYFKCFINCVQYHILVSSTICCLLLTKGEFPLLLTGCSPSKLKVS